MAATSLAQCVGVAPACWGCPGQPSAVTTDLLPDTGGRAGCLPGRWMNTGASASSKVCAFPRFIDRSPAVSSRRYSTKGSKLCPERTMYHHPRRRTTGARTAPSAHPSALRQARAWRRRPEPTQAHGTPSPSQFCSTSSAAASQGGWFPGARVPYSSAPSSGGPASGKHQGPVASPCIPTATHT